MTRHIVLTVLCGLVVSAAGCSGLGYLGYLLAPPEREETVPADYDNLPGHSVAVVVFCGHALQFEHPALRLELSSVIAREMREQLEDVTVADPMRVARYQERNLHWDSLPKTELAEKLDADYVLLVSVVDFRTREVAGPDTFRGRVVAEASLYKASLPERRAQVRRYGDLSVAYSPDDRERTAWDPRDDTHYQLQRLLAEQIVRKFHEHKVSAGREES